MNLEWREFLLQILELFSDFVSVPQLNKQIHFILLLYRLFAVKALPCMLNGNAPVKKNGWNAGAGPVYVPFWGSRDTGGLDGTEENRERFWLTGGWQTGPGFVLSGVLSIAEGAEISPFWTSAKEVWSLGKAPSRGGSVGGSNGGEPSVGGDAGGVEEPPFCNWVESSAAGV